MKPSLFEYKLEKKSDQEQYRDSPISFLLTSNVNLFVFEA